MRRYAPKVHRKPTEDRVQTRLEIGRPDDPYEREANATADQVMRMPSGVAEEDKVDPMRGEGAIRMQTEEDEPLRMMPEEEEEPLRMMPEDETEPLRMMPEEEEEPLRMMPEEESLNLMEEEDEQISMQEDEEERIHMQEKGAPARSSAAGKQFASRALADQVHRTKGAGKPLPGQTRQELEHKMKADFSGVRIHTGSEAEAMNQKLGAKAFAHGQDLYFNQGNYDPGSSKGKHLLVHELTHVMQQRGKETIQKQEETSSFQRPDNDSFVPYPPNIEKGLQKKERWAYTAAAKWDLAHNQVSFKAMDQIEAHSKKAFNSHHFVRLTDFYYENAKKEGTVSPGETEEAYKLCSPAMYYAMNKLYNWTGSDKIKSGYVVDSGDIKGIVTLMREKGLVGDHKRVTAIDEDGNAGHYSDKEVIALNHSPATWAKDQTEMNAVGVFLVSVHGGYHSMTMVVDRRGKGALEYRLLDQHETTDSGFDRTSEHTAKEIDDYFVTMAQSWGDIHSNHTFDVYELLRD